MAESSEESVENFSKYLRQATKDVHKISDVLVTAKFALALSDDLVWADGILVFYEIYKFFELHTPPELIPAELRRTEAIERDLSYFLGSDWKLTYVPRPEVVAYLNQLERVKEKNPTLLFAYAFQMYMALMSGGQILQKKRQIARKLNPFRPVEELQREGCALTTFGDHSVPELKEKLRSILHEKVKEFDDEMRAAFVEESRNVFIFNNQAIRSVKGVGRANQKKLFIVLTGILISYIMYKFIY